MLGFIGWLIVVSAHPFIFGLAVGCIVGGIIVGSVILIDVIDGRKRP